MNDHDAIDAINEALERYFDGHAQALATIGLIAHISGLNKIEHEEQS